MFLIQSTFGVHPLKMWPVEFGGERSGMSYNKMSCNYLRSIPIRRVPNPVDENPIWNILGSAISGVISVALSLPFLLGFLLVLPACLSVRWLLLYIHYNRQGSRSSPVTLRLPWLLFRARKLERLTLVDEDIPDVSPFVIPKGIVSGPESVRSNDSRWLGTEWRSSVIHAVLVFEAKEGVNVDHFRRLLLKRVIPLYPRLTQRLISLPITAGVGNCWLTDSKFSINDHVFSGPSFLNNEKDLQNYVSKLIENGLPEDKPPWQLQVFQNFGASRDTVVILRVHQSVADGTALLRLLCHSLADSQVIEIPERPRFGSFAFCMNVFRACVVGPLTLFFWLFLSGGDCNILTHRSTWTGSVTVTWSASITLPKVIRIKQVTRSTVNCVLLSALAGALRRLFQGCGIKQPPNVKVVVPMDLRNQSSSSPLKTRLGNKTSSQIMPLPVAVEGCVPRLWATRKTLESLRTSADPVILYVATAALMSVGSASFARHLVNFLADKASLQFSSLPGPTSEIFLEGQTLKGIYPIIPAQANLGISITTITYADQVFVSVIAERALGPAAELILEYLEDQVEILWKLLLNRRVPGEPESPTLFTKSRISESPVREITSRLNLVQKEVERLSEGKENDKEGKLSTLRAEFSELVDELKRRQSLNELEDSDSSWKPRSKGFSCPSKRASISPKSLRHFNSSDFQALEFELTDRTSGKYHPENLNLKPHKSTKFGSPVQSKCDSSNSKDCVIIISENNTSTKLPCRPTISKRKNDNDSFIHNKLLEVSSKSDLMPNKSNQIRPKLEENSKDISNLTGKCSRTESGKDLPSCTGPKFDLTYQNYLVNYLQPPYPYSRLGAEKLFEGSDDPEIVGGVII